MNTQTNFVKTVVRSICSLVLLLGLLAAPQKMVRADALFTVTTNYDYNPGAANGTCWNGVVEGCGLRDAIVEANAASGNKTINFSTGMAGQTIYLSSAYGGSLILSGDNITIDGSTSGGDIIIDDGGLAANSNIFEIQGSYNTIRSLMLRGWPDVRNPDANHGHGVFIHDTTGSGLANYNTLDYLRIFGFEHDGVLISGDSGGGGHDNTIAHSLIGAANWASTTCVAGSENKWYGIQIAQGADNTNVNSSHVVCNYNNGILIDGSTGGGISDTNIQSNLIGTDGTHDMGNGSSGIFDLLATGTQIYNNIISGNSGSGIWLSGSTNAVVTANRIGTNAAGSAALENGQDGVTILNNANGNTLGSATDANGRNIISGNHLCGVDILTGANNNGILGNYIGLGADGSTVVPNGTAGVAIIGATNNALSSGLGTDPAQFISGNLREGVYVEDADVPIVNWQTYIGVASDMTTAKPNGLEGIMLNGVTNAIIRPGAVVNNGWTGIAVISDGSAGNRLAPLAVYSNGGLPIDLGDDGPTANDAGDGDTGPNGLLNYPEPNIIVAGGFTGMTCPGCYVLIYRASGDPRAAGGGGTLLNSLPADSTTGDFSYSFPAGVASVSLIACQTASPYNCSEMSPKVDNPPYHYVFLPLVIR
jgi:parallel beta-helix repeat protein